jgi:hypothetical protein
MIDKKPETRNQKPEVTAERIAMKKGLVFSFCFLLSGFWFSASRCANQAGARLDPPRCTE